MVKLEESNEKWAKKKESLKVWVSNCKYTVVDSDHKMTIEDHIGLMEYN